MFRSILNEIRIGKFSEPNKKTLRSYMGRGLPIQILPTKNEVSSVNKHQFVSKTGASIGSDCSWATEYAKVLISLLRVVMAVELGHGHSSFAGIEIDPENSVNNCEQDKMKLSMISFK